MKPLTRAQREAIKLLYDRRECPSASYLTFRRSFHQCFGDYVGSWQNEILIGIEPDGYTHT